MPAQPAKLVFRTTLCGPILVSATPARTPFAGDWDAQQLSEPPLSI